MKTRTLDLVEDLGLDIMEVTKGTQIQFTGDYRGYIQKDFIVTIR